MPAIPENWAEGVVIKPLKELLVGSKRGEVRAIVKNKSKRFKEDSRYLQAKKWEVPNEPNEFNLQILTAEVLVVVSTSLSL